MAVLGAISRAVFAKPRGNRGVFTRRAAFSEIPNGLTTCLDHILWIVEKWRKPLFF